MKLLMDMCHMMLWCLHMALVSHLKLGINGLTFRMGKVAVMYMLRCVVWWMTSHLCIPGH